MNTNEFKPETVVTDEGVTFEPWSDGRAIGFKVSHPDRPTRYIYLNPSGSTDTGNVDDSDAFLYLGEHGDPGEDESVVFVNIWDAQS